MSSVVLFHLWPHVVRGGYVGVDVFFVISGFLITQQLADQLTRTGRIYLTDFWARRIRRILPAAYVVLGASIAMLVAFMPRLTWSGNLDEIRAAAAYVENWLLGAHAVDYLAAQNSPTLVQHYWSLSVEEQFYVVWPLLILTIVFVAGRLKIRRRLGVVTALAGVAVASFIVSVEWTSQSRAVAFFATPTRAWEFAVGGLIGVAVRPRSWRITQRAVAVVRAAGAILIAASVMFITSHAAFPGSIALLPVGGAALVLLAVVMSPTQSATRAVGHPAIQWLGDNSYSIYLWHWPLIIVAPWVTRSAERWPQKLAIIGLSLALAALTKRLVEDPIRRGRLWRARRWPAYSFAVVTVVTLALLTSGMSINVRHAEAREAEAAQDRAQAASQAMFRPHHRSCFGAAAMLATNHCRRPFARPANLDTSVAADDGRMATYQCLSAVDATTPQFCEFGRTSHPARIIAVVGNSHARRLIPALALYGEHHDWEVVLAAHINCMGLTMQPIGPSEPLPACQSWSQQVIQRLLAWPRLSAVVFASHLGAGDYLFGAHPTPAVQSSARADVVRTWSAFVTRGIRVIVTQDVPGMRPYSDPECIAQSTARYDPCAMKRSKVVLPNFMTELAVANPRLVDYVQVAKYFCDAMRCHALIGGVVVYFDSHHLTTTFSRSLAPYLGADIAAALRSSSPR